MAKRILSLMILTALVSAIVGFIIGFMLADCQNDSLKTNKSTSDYLTDEILVYGQYSDGFFFFRKMLTGKFQMILNHLK